MKQCQRVLFFFAILFPSSPFARAAADGEPIMISVCAARLETQGLVSLADGGMVNLRIMAPEGSDWTADLEAHLSAGPSPVVASGPSPRATVSLDKAELAECSLPCSVSLQNVAPGEHVITATATGLETQSLRFRLLRLGDETAEVTGIVYTRDAVPVEGSGEAQQHKEEADLGLISKDGRYAAILFPFDDTCITDVHHAYVSISMTEAFFKLPDSHDVITRFETTVFCIANDDGFARPAPMDYDPKTQGTLIQCHKYESEFALRNGYGYMLNSSNPVNAHDCPPGTICKNDLEDGYMVDFWLVVARYDCLFKSMS